jgi:anhydro-N-acetylmuramic acid kinase
MHPAAQTVRRRIGRTALTKQIHTVIGLMSGTSLDGIDLALIKTDGEAFIERGPWATRSYSAQQRSILLEALEAAKTLESRHDRPGILAAAETMITAAHAEIVAEFLASGDIDPNSIDLIGFHGQTVLHRPQIGLTVQLGNGQALADMVGIPVVYDMRANDMVAGGQGAPLVPVFHQAIVETSNLAGPVAVLNLGGVGNLTYIDGDNDPLAFDTGPGNALIDDEMRLRFGRDYDEDGVIGGQGQVNQTALSILMSNPYFKATLPKSLDRNAFSREPVAALAAEEAVATLTAFTAASIQAAGHCWRRSAEPNAAHNDCQSCPRSRDRR